MGVYKRNEIDMSHVGAESWKSIAVVKKNGKIIRRFMERDELGVKVENKRDAAGLLCEKLTGDSRMVSFFGWVCMLRKTAN